MYPEQWRDAGWGMQGKMIGDMYCFRESIYYFPHTKL